jgi:hypothetical protein
MRKFIQLLLTIILALAGYNLKAQNANVREAADTINSLLKANPYFDNFLEITINYSIEISPENVLAVKMESAGSFKTVFKIKIADLDNSRLSDSCSRANNSIYLYCKSTGVTDSDRCVIVEGTMPGGEEANFNQDNIIVMFSNRKGICKKLNEAFGQLFASISEPGRE